MWPLRRSVSDSRLDRAVEIIVITGMSGAGRSEAMHTFEDLGYFCIDNLPPSFIRQLIELASLPGSKLGQIAVTCDVRGHEFFDELGGEMDRLEKTGIDLRLLFMEADDEVLLRRFKETRRRHPMCDDEHSLLEGIQAERAALAELRERADVVIDTSELRPQGLRQVLREKFSGSRSQVLAITVYSFGFKHSIPADADMVVDVRFLPNPYYDPELRPFTGLDDKVRTYVLDHPQTIAFMEKWTALLDTVVPGYVQEGKHHLAIALGCTGGMHRSVALAEATAEHLREAGFGVTVVHRDLDKDRLA